MGGMERGEGRGGEGGKGWTVNAEEFGSGSRQTLSHNDCHNQIVPLLQYLLDHVPTENLSEPTHVGSAIRYALRILSCTRTWG